MQNSAIKQTLLTKLGLDQQNAKVLVVGLGVTGMSVAKFLHKHNFQFAIVDNREQPPQFQELTEQLPGVALFTGGFDQDAFEVATHMVVSPGLGLDEKNIQQALNKGVRIVSDIDLFACSVEQPIVSISGSNGKSTVTSILGLMLEKAGKKVAMGANLGVPALDLLEKNAEIYVLELSSFQLERTHVLNTAVGSVLNITPDHIDRHGNIEDYSAAKARIFNGDGIMVLNTDDSRVMNLRIEGRKTLTFGLKNAADFHISQIDGKRYFMHHQEPLMATNELPLEGCHNQENALAALALGSAVGLQEQQMCDALRAFKGLEHRMQRVAEVNGVTWINDSKATNIGACLAALQDYDHNVILIAGGDAKGAKMDELVKVIKQKARTVILIGKDAGLIAEALGNYLPVHFEQTITQAVNTAAKLAQQGESVLLSPACASIDQFKNYQERGQKFVDAVKELAV